MKPQDIFFIVVLAFLIWKASPRLSAACGVTLLVMSIPLFAFWIFFTAERFTWYAFGFFLLATLQSFKKIYYENRY